MTAPAPLPAPDDSRYLALCSRDARFDGQFFTGVTSTGIYCRPVCAVRTPRREHCRFFTLAAQAESAGFRPCLRCRPDAVARDRAAIDEAITVWCQERGHEVSYCVPSIVDHADGPTLIDHPDGIERDMPRRAVLFADPR